MTVPNVPMPHPVSNSTNEDPRPLAVPASADHIDESFADTRIAREVGIDISAALLVGAGAAMIAATSNTIADGTIDQSTSMPAPTSGRYPSWSFRRLRSGGRQPGSLKYRLPLTVMAAAALASFRNRKRDLRDDTARLIASMPVAPVVNGIENLPTTRPYVILPNHYERPSGAWVGWGAIIITNAIARHRSGSFPIRWVMTSTWQDCYVGPKRINPKYLHWVLRRMSDLYGIILMPANDIDAFGRGAALRDLFRALSDPAGQVVAFHPEAGGFETMIRPPKGIGRVLAMIDRQGIQMIPTGVYEDDGQFHVTFGSAVPSGSLLHLSDAEAAAEVMARIARLVPERTRGDFAECLTAAVGESRD